MQSIKNIQIPQPCHQSWQQMTPVNQGRHCTSCCKTVVDFTAMSNNEIIGYLATSQHVCGRFGHEQLNSINNQLEIQNRQSNSWRRWVMVIGLLSQTLFDKATAQTKTVKATTHQTEPSYNSPVLGKVAMPDTSQKTKLSGLITDEQHQPLPGVTIKIKGTNTGTLTDTYGRFTLHNAKPGDIIDITYIGFNTQEIAVNTVTGQPCNITMKQSMQLLGEPAIVYRKPSFVKRTWHKVKRIF